MNKNGFENKLNEVNSLMQSILSILNIMCKAGENTNNEELKQFIESLVLLTENVKKIQQKQEIIIAEFSNYCS